ncbi:MAG: DUF1287 domain-containing protein [Alteromonadaceae bacterium]|nr:MAG: DUF1287 domain-containing protein [Alteromonadaceae bacterium]
MKKLILLTSILLSQNAISQNFTSDIVLAAIERTKHEVRYDGAYFSIPYPNGDVPANIGVCTDLVIRSYRAIGADLQTLVHEDMMANFGLYPSERIWSLTSTDRNIDHRRVPNLQVFFTRHGESLPITTKKHDYAPGDLVTWMLPGNRPHIGIITNQISPKTRNPLVAHNIGFGPKLDDALFTYPISGHYRYVPKKYHSIPVQAEP